MMEMEMDLKDWGDLFATSSLYDDDLQGLKLDVNTVKNGDGKENADFSAFKSFEDEPLIDSGADWLDDLLNLSDLEAANDTPAVSLPTSNIDLTGSAASSIDLIESALLASGLITPQDSDDSFNLESSTLHIPDQDVPDDLDDLISQLTPPMSPDDAELLLSNSPLSPEDKSILDGLGFYGDDHTEKETSGSLHSLLTSYHPYERDSDSDPDYVPTSFTVKSKIKTAGKSNTTDRKIKKKLQNKTAATRYREKKRQLNSTIFIERENLEKRNTELKEKVEQMTNEIEYLKDLMKEVYEARGLIKK